MYIRIAFSIELRLRVSRSLRSLANKCTYMMCAIIVLHAPYMQCKVSYSFPMKLLAISSPTILLLKQAYTLP